MAQVAVLAFDVEELARITVVLQERGLGARHVVWAHDTIAGFLGAIRERVMECVITPVCTSDGRSTAALLMRLKQWYPCMPLIAYGVGEMRAQHFFWAGRAGADELIIARHDVLAMRVQACVNRRARERVLRALAQCPENIPGGVRDVIEFGVRYPAAAFSVEWVSQQLLLTSSALARQCRLTGLPTPRELLVWCKVLSASVLLGEPGRTLESVERYVGMPSGLIGRFLRRHAGVMPGMLRDEDGVVRVFEAFGRAMRAEGETLAPPLGRVRARTGNSLMKGGRLLL